MTTYQYAGRRGGLATVTRLVSADTLEAVPVAQVQGTLALDLYGARGMPAIPEYDPAIRSRLEATRGVELKGWSARFAQAVVEAVGGDRPVTQLVLWTSRRVYADLERRVRLVGLARGSMDRARTIRPQVRSVHVFQPSPATAEVSVHVRHGQRSRALAARLERRDDRWMCTALELG